MALTSRARIGGPGRLLDVEREARALRKGWVPEW